jgi:serine/threonine protein kinase
MDPDATGALSVDPGLSSSSTSNEERFTTGSVFGERFRMLGRIGRGGMGEVYRAHDLKLDQPVALKFLPEAARDNRRLEFFRNEVRIARQISHRNVCRVYDLGEIEGAPFISMEYVDGEDLGSLLRRIGRLPGDKAVEFARRLCAGLAAAHEKGVLHRDLKPANIMIDGRGQVLIMDFGLAAVADAIAGGDIRSGTPAYMSPEQKDGREVTVRSDIYSLGLVLAEMFTGQRALKDLRLSTVVRDVDPAVEKVIERCLDPNPSRRPASALDVARALPGGDPLAEACSSDCVRNPFPFLSSSRGTPENMAGCRSRRTHGRHSKLPVRSRPDGINRCSIRCHHLGRRRGDSHALWCVAHAACDICQFGSARQPADNGFFCLVCEFNVHGPCDCTGNHTLEFPHRPWWEETDNRKSSGELRFVI